MPSAPMPMCMCLMRFSYVRSWPDNLILASVLLRRIFTHGDMTYRRAF